jgi:hypothetical protein
VIVVIATLNEFVFEIEKLNSSVTNCGCFEFVITFVMSSVVLCTVLLMLRLIVDWKENVACFGEG